MKIRRILSCERFARMKSVGRVVHSWPACWRKARYRFLAAILGAGLLGNAAGDCSAPPAGLVAWWPAEGNASDIVGSNNGTLQGGATAAATGNVGFAFSFNGTNGYVQIPDSPAFHPAVFTIEAWVKFTALNSAGTGPAQGEQFIVFKQNSRSSNFEGIYLGKTLISNQ